MIFFSENVTKILDHLKVREYDVIKQNIDSILRQDREPERGKETERG